jgi:hypothetical protein
VLLADGLSVDLEGEISTFQIEAELELVAALALSWPVEEAAAGGRMITRLGSDPQSGATRVEAHLRLAQAAAASRWAMSRHHLDRARRLAGADPSPATVARIDVLDADLAMAANDYGAASGLAELNQPCAQKASLTRSSATSWRSSGAATAWPTFPRRAPRSSPRSSPPERGSAIMTAPCPRTRCLEASAGHAGDGTPVRR